MKVKEYSEKYHLFTSACLNLTNQCCCDCKYCMPSGTKILMTNGKVKNIENISVGDQVIGTQEYEYPKKILTTTVTQLFQRTVSSYLKLTMLDGRVLQLTDNHPVLNDKNEWIEAKDLKEKDKIKSLGTNAFYDSTVDKIEIIEEDITVYNFETDLHTYVAEGLVVHNCFVKQSNQSMNLQTAQAAVTMVHDNLVRKRELDNNPNLKGVINYFGGEPMLEYDSIIVPLTIWIEETYPDDFNLGITTNGVLLNKERIDFLYDHNIVPLLSMDGDKKTQDYNRPCKNGKSSFDQIIPVIPYLLEKFPNTVFRMTIYEDTCDKLFENILFAEKQGFKYFFATPDTRHNFSKENEKKLGIELEKFYTYLIGSLVQGVKPIESSFMKDMIIQALKEPSLEIKELDSILPREIFRCGLGTTSVGIAPNGDIYGCQEQVTNKDSIFYIGDIFNGINEEKHHNLIANFRILMQIQSETPSKCLKCSYRKMCNDVECPSMAQFRFNNFFTVPNTLCFWRNKLFTLTKTLLQVYHPNIEKYLTEIVEQEESYELYNSRNRVS